MRYNVNHCPQMFFGFFFNKHMVAMFSNHDSSTSYTCIFVVQRKMSLLKGPIGSSLVEHDIKTNPVLARS